MRLSDIEFPVLITILDMAIRFSMLIIDVI